MTEMSIATAIALTWNSSVVRVKCPYSCSSGIHCHGFTSTDPSKPNTRMPHCVPQKDDDGNHVFSPEYRLLFPFDDDPETEGMWWELDHDRTRWRTVSWSVYDPEYWEDRDPTEEQTDSDGQNEFDSQTAVGSVTDIANALSNLTFDHLETRTNGDSRLESSSQTAVEDATRDGDALSSLNAIGDEMPEQPRILFNSFCVCNFLQQAQAMLLRAADATELVNGKALGNGKPILIAVVEEGHHDIIDLLLKYGANLECRDCNGDTSLLRALECGRGILAEKLIDAGADLDAHNNDGETVRDKARTSLEAQRESVRFENMMIHPRETPLIYIEFNEDNVRKNIHTRGKEICALRRIIASYDRKQTIKQFLIQLRRIGEMYGEEQAESVEQHGELDDQALLVRLLRQLMDTPRETEWKTVACLVRGTALPWIFAVSGYSTSSPDDVLYRPEWIERVFDLAKLVGHELLPDHRDGKRRQGSFLACHSEKQLLAYFVWSHTTKLCSRGERSLDALHLSEARQLSKLHAEIYVCQPGQRRAYICSDCYDFCERAVQHLGFRLTLKCVIQGRVTKTVELPPGN